MAQQIFEQGQDIEVARSSAKFVDDALEPGLPKKLDVQAYTLPTGV